MAPLTRLAVLVTLVVSSVGLSAAARAEVDPVEAAEDLGLTCAPVTSADGVKYTKCTGELPSFDGVGLDTDLSLPVKGKAPLPTLLMLHGWSGDKTNWQASSRDGDGNPDKYHWNNVWFVSKGYAVVNYTARGFQGSCGQSELEADCVFPPNRAWTHLADRRWETRDSQHILGLLVDAGIADPERLASTGGSYGGGQSWLLATSLPWDSPDGVELQLAGAVPKYPWTDLLNSLTPNGRASDDVDQTPSHETPFGIPKESYIAGLYAAGRAVGDGRYNTSDPSEVHSDLDAQFLRVQAGDPYEPDPVIDAIAAEYRHKSPYYAQDYFAALSAETIEPVPVFSIQGWTDPLFPAAETLQMYRKLKAADPDYPVYMAFGDIGHSNAQNPPRQWRHINGQGNQFLNTFVGGRGGGTPTTNVFAFITQCPETQGSQPPLSGTDWDHMASGLVTANGLGSRMTSSAPPDPEETETDPIVNMDTCLTNSTAPKPATWAWTVPDDGFTQVGLPEVEVSYSLAGLDATVAFKLWDVPPTGDKVLVDRGMYRLSVAGGDDPAGTIDLDLFGNAWRWEEGHQIQLQVSQTDTAYLRPDNLLSSISWSNPQLTIPIRQGFTQTLTSV
jgi:predicted acyl esterase